MTVFLVFLRRESFLGFLQLGNFGTRLCGFAVEESETKFEICAVKSKQEIDISAQNSETGS